MKTDNDLRSDAHAAEIQWAELETRAKRLGLEFGEDDGAAQGLDEGYWTLWRSEDRVCDGSGGCYGAEMFLTGFEAAFRLEKGR